jgi:hypothetical protein
VNFWSVWSGLGPICNHFSETEGPAGSFPNAQGPVACGAPGAVGFKRSSAKAREEEGNETEPVRGSPELER